jgi:zinc protease
MHAAFPPDEWQQEREVILREVSMGKDDPDRVLNELLWSTAFRVHPYRVPVIGYEDVLRTMTRDDLVGLFRRHYVPDNMIAVVVGDIESADIEAALRRTFAGFARRPRPPVSLPPEPPQTAPRLVRKTGAYHVARLHCVYHTVPLSHPDAPALDLLAAIVGRGRSSRLNQEFRETRRLVHSIEAWSYTPLYPGLFGITAAFDPAQEEELLAALRAHVQTWSEGPFTEAELAKARRTTVVEELAALQSAGGQAGSYVSGEFMAGDPRFAEAYLHALFAVAATDLVAVARRYLREDNRTVAVLSPDATPAAAPPPPAEIRAAPVGRTMLSKGVPLVFREDHRLPFVHLCIAFRGGVLSEDPRTSGITQLMSDLMIRGTRRHSARSLATLLESLGADLSPFAGYNSFGFRVRCLTADADRLAAVVAECLAAPAFPTEETEKQRTVQLAAIAQRHEQPFALVQETLDGLIFPGHPYRWPPAGTPTTVQALTRDDLLAHHRREVVSGNMAVAVFGDITPEAARRLGEACTRGLRADEAPARPRVTCTPDLPKRTAQREPKQQAIVLLGFPGISLRDPRREAVEILQVAMSGLSSRLSEEIRERRGLAYYAGASERAGLEPGLFFVYAGTRPDAAGQVETLLGAEVARVAAEGLTPDELERSRNQIIADHDMRLQDNGELAMICALNGLYGLGADYEFTTRERFQAVTAEQVRLAAASLLTTNRMATAVLLPAAQAPGPAD